MFWLLNHRLRTHTVGPPPNLHRWQYTLTAAGYELTVHGVINGLLWRLRMQLVTDYSIDSAGHTRRLRLERLRHG